MAKTFDKMFIDEQEYHYADIDLRNGDVPFYLKDLYDEKHKINGVVNAANVSALVNPGDYDDRLITTAAAWHLMDYYWTCLIAGTQILMADGTTKNIEDVKVGDIVKSYNPTTQELCEAVVIVAEKTGESNSFTNFIFEDGNNLIIYGDHGYYNPLYGHIRNIKDDAKKDFSVLNQDLQVQKCIVRDKYLHQGRRIGRYNIATSNNLYFANGILCGQSPFAKYNYYLRHSTQLPKNIETLCELDTNAYNEWNSLMSNSTYLKESADARKRRVAAHTAETAARNELDSLDYKTLKHSEGVLTEEEFNEVIVRKEELRVIVNEQHELFVQARDEVQEISKKYRTLSYADLFKLCCDRDNAALDQFKDWLCK